MPEELDFFDVKTKKKFRSSKWKRVVKGKTVFAVAKSPSGINAHRIIGRKK